MNQSLGIARAKGIFDLTNVVGDEVLLRSALSSGSERLIIGHSIPTLGVKTKMQEAANPAFQELERIRFAPRTEIYQLSKR